MLLSEQLLAPVGDTWLGASLAELRHKLAASLTPEGRRYIELLRRCAIALGFAPTRPDGHVVEVLEEATQLEHGDALRDARQRRDGARRGSVRAARQRRRIRKSTWFAQARRKRALAPRLEAGNFRRRWQARFGEFSQVAWLPTPSCGQRLQQGPLPVRAVNRAEVPALLPERPTRGTLLSVSTPSPSDLPEMTVDLLGRLRNTSVPLSHAYLPVLEAVLNSIHAIEDRFGRQAMHRGTITVTIERDGQAQLPSASARGRSSLEGIRSISVRDNGTGFTDASFEAFLTADTAAKLARGGKGVGRFSWLVVFQRALIESTYRDLEGKPRLRKFTFEPRLGGITSLENTEAQNGAEPYALVRLEEPKRRYEDGLRRGAGVVAERIFEHCFNYFIMEQSPRIDVIDEANDDAASVNDHKAEILADSVDEIEVTGHKLEVRSIHRKYGAGRKHHGHLCANERVVTSFPLSSVSKLFSPLEKPDGTRFVHELFVTGKALDDSVDASRTRLDLPDGEPLFEASGELDLKTLRARLGEHVDALWAEKFAQEEEENFQRVTEHIRTVQPEYRHLIERKPDSIRTVKWDDNPGELDRRLYSVQQEYETEVRDKQRRVEQELLDVSEDPDRLAEALEAVIAQVNELGQSNLVRYVAKRRGVLQLIRRLTSRSEGPALEEHIHRIVFPMRKSGDSVSYDEHNLWLVDDTLSFYEHIASDIRLDKNRPAPADSPRRPDLLAFKTGDPYQHVALLEFKKPERDDENPVQQLVDYSVLLRDGGAKDAAGRTMPGIDKSVRIDAYAVCSLTPAMVKRLRSGPGNMVPVDGNERWYGGVPPENLTVEVLDYRAFMRRAEQRTRAFFVKLGLM